MYYVCSFCMYVHLYYILSVLEISLTEVVIWFVVLLVALNKTIYIITKLVREKDLLYELWKFPERVVENIVIIVCNDTSRK